MTLLPPDDFCIPTALDVLRRGGVAVRLLTDDSRCRRLLTCGPASSVISNSLTAAPWPAPCKAPAAGLAAHELAPLRMGDCDEQ